MSEAKKAEVVPTETQAPAVTPMQMLQIAVDKGADLEMLNKLMDLQERYEANEARKAFVLALAEFKADPPKVKKNARVEFNQTSYDYLTLPEAVAVIAPKLSEHGLSHNWSVNQSDTRISVSCQLTHRMGHSESVTLTAAPDDSGKKNSIQAIGSTVTYLQRYSLLAITGLAASGTDDDGGGNVETISEEQVRDLEDLIDSAEADKEKFLIWLNVETLADLKAEFYDRAVNALEAKRSKG